MELFSYLRALYEDDWKVPPMAGFDEGELETGLRQVGLRRHFRKEWQEPPKA